MLRTRVLTAIVLAIVILATVFGLETRYAAMVFGLIWLIGTDEWARLAKLPLPLRACYDILFTAVVVVALGPGLPEIATTVWLAVAALVWLMTFGLVLRYPVSLPTALVAAIGLIVLPAAWLSFYWLHGPAPRGPGLVLAAVIIVWSADVGAYFTGRSLGHTPLSPNVSPKKTWEGVAGGVALATLTGLLAATLLDLPVLALGVTAAAMALISVVGDLGVSMLKRRAGLKDSGVLLPGHGGIMDRFDGVTAALPFLVLGLQFTHVLD